MEKTLLPREKKGIIYEVLQANDLEKTISCIVKVFPGREPMTKSQGIIPEEFYSFAEIYTKKALKEGLSIIAKDKVNGKVIGICISEDFVVKPPEGMETINDKLQPILGLVFDLDEQYKKAHKLEIGQFLHIFLLGVIEDYEGMSIATTLVEENLKLAKQKNFKGAIAEVTGLISQHILRDKFGFEEELTTIYKSYTYNEVRVFKNIENPRNCILMVKRF